MKIKHGGAKIVRGVNGDEQYNVSYSLVSYTDGSVSDPTSSAIKDMTTVEVTGGTTKITAADLLITAIPSHANKYPFEIENLNPELALLSGTRVIPKTTTSSSVSLLIKDKFTKKKITVGINKTPYTGTYTTVTGYADDSLAAKLTESLDTLLVGKTSTNDILYVTNVNDWHTNIVRNSNLWATGVDMTAFALSSGTYEQVANPDPLLWEGGQKSATVISPRHVVTANHHRPARCYWVGSDDSLVYREIIAWKYVLGSTDVAIGIVAEDFPATIKQVSILPSNWRDYLPTANDTRSKGIPVAYMDSGGQSNITEQDYTRRLGVILWRGEVLNPRTQNYSLCTTAPTNAKQYSFFNTQVHPNILYRSGSPVFAIINSEPILLGCWHLASGLNAYAPLLSDYIPGINATMASLTATYNSGGTNYTIKTAASLIDSYQTY